MHSGTFQLTENVLLSFEHQEIVCGQRKIRLSDVQFNIMCILIDHYGEAVDSAELITGVWGHCEGVSQEALCTHISRLRKRLGAPDCIQSVRGCGYILKVRDPQP